MVGVRDFKQINSVNFNPAIAATQQAGNQFNRGFDALNRSVAGLRAINTAEDEQLALRNTQTIQSALEKETDYASLKQAEDSGQFGIEALRSQFGSNFDPIQVSKAIDTAKSRLQGDLIDQASVIGEQAATETGDVNQASDAVYKTLMSKGADAGWAKEQATSWGNKARADATTRMAFSTTKKQTADKAAVSDALTTFSNRITGGEDASKALADVSTDLTGSQRAALTKQARTLEENVSKLSPLQRAEYEQATREEQATLEAVDAMGKQELQQLQADDASFAKVISPEVSNHFADAADPKGHVVDWFRDEVGDDTLVGIFPSITSGSAAVDWISNKFNKLTKGNKLSEKDAGAIIVQAWKSTYADQNNWVGKGVNEEVMDKEIQERTDALKQERQRKAAINTKMVQHNTRMQSERNKMAKKLHDFSVGKYRQNLTGKAPVSKKLEEASKEASTTGNKITREEEDKELRKLITRYRP